MRINTYPTKSPLCPAAVNNSLTRTLHVPPAGRVPSAASPKPGRTVALVVRENAALVPVAVDGKKSMIIVPAPSVAPPLPAPNGSRVVLAIEIPVSNPATFSTNGISIVVLEATMFPTVAGPTSAVRNRGIVTPLVVDPAALATLVAKPEVLVVGNIDAVTVIDPTDGVDVGEVIGPSVSWKASIAFGSELKTSITVVLFDELKFVVAPDAIPNDAFAVFEVKAPTAMVEVAGIPLNVSRIKVAPTPEAPPVQLPFVHGLSILFCVLLRHAKLNPSVTTTVVVRVLAFLFVKTAIGPLFVVPGNASCFIDAIPSPTALTTGNDVVLRMKLFALLFREAVALAGVVNPLPSILVPRTRNDPELPFAIMALVSPISDIVRLLPTRVMIVADEKRPVAARIRIPSPAGRSRPPTVPSASVEIAVGKVKVNQVVLRFELAMRDPVT